MASKAAPRLAGRSRAEQFAIALADPKCRPHLIQAMKRGKAEALEQDWGFWRREDQDEPPPSWHTWLVMAGRGFGKTRMGAEWIRAIAGQGEPLRIALVAATLNDARSVMVEGESGLLAISPDDGRPMFEPSLRRLTWPGGTQATLYSAAEPEGLRGPQHHFAWCDEIAKWPMGAETWDNLLLGLRLGKRPKAMATTTPRPVPLVRRLLSARDTAVTCGPTTANASNLSESFIATVTDLYGGTALGRQELEGELIEESEGALWRRAAIEAGRIKEPPENLCRVVVGVDPPAGIGGDACGIVVVGLGADDHGYVLEDASVHGLAPEGWARAVAQAAARHRADRVVAEANNGGAMVESVLTAADAGLPVTMVNATRSKTARAEPVSALYDRGKVHHVRAWPALEDEMCGLLAGGGYVGPGRSPDRADALVWALTELMLRPKGVVPVVRRL